MGFFEDHLDDMARKHARATKTATLVSAAVLRELGRAMRAHGPLNSEHEAYAVILEELDEFWDEVKTKGATDDDKAKELIQVAAMAIRAIVDLRLPVEVEQTSD